MRLDNKRGEVALIGLIDKSFYGIVTEAGESEEGDTWYKWSLKGSNNQIICVSGDVFTRIDLAERSFKKAMKLISAEPRYISQLSRERLIAKGIFHPGDDWENA